MSDCHKMIDEKEEGVKFYKFPDDMTTARRYADESWGDLANLLEDKYGFTIDDIVFSDWRTHCEYCGGKFDTKKRAGFSRFTEDFMNFCFSLGQRRLEVEKRNSEQASKGADG